MTPPPAVIIITPENPLAHCSQELLRSAAEELDKRYPEENAHEVLPEGIGDVGGVFIVARLNGIRAGCGALRRMSSGVAEVKRMFVASYARRMGLGRCILHELESQAVQLEYKTIRLETGIRQPEALHLYESAGYQHDTCYDEYIDNPLSVCFVKHLGN